MLWGDRSVGRADHEKETADVPVHFSAGREVNRQKAWPYLM